MPSVGELWGFVMALAVISVCFTIFTAICRAIIGNIGTALLYGFIALYLLWLGWKWLAFNDHLALAILGWGIPTVVLAVGTLWVVGTVAERREAKRQAEPVEDTAPVEPVVETRYLAPGETL